MPKRTNKIAEPKVPVGSGMPTAAELRRGRQTQAIAFLGGHHARTGQNSILMLLPPDVMVTILTILDGKREEYAKRDSGTFDLVEYHLCHPVTVARYAGGHLLSWVTKGVLYDYLRKLDHRGRPYPATLCARPLGKRWGLVAYCDGLKEVIKFCETGLDETAGIAWFWRDLVPPTSAASPVERAYKYIKRFPWSANLLVKDLQAKMNSSVTVAPDLHLLQAVVLLTEEVGLAMELSDSEPVPKRRKIA